MRSHAQRSIICAVFIGAFALNPGCSDPFEFDEAELDALLAVANADAPFEFESEGEHYRVELVMQRALQPTTMSINEGDVKSVVTADIRLFQVEAPESSELLKQALVDGEPWLPTGSLRGAFFIFDASGRVNGLFLALRSADGKHFQLDQAAFHMNEGAFQMEPNVVFFRAQRADP